MLASLSKLIISHSNTPLHRWTLHSNFSIIVKNIDLANSDNSFHNINNNDNHNNHINNDNHNSKNNNNNNNNNIDDTNSKIIFAITQDNTCCRSCPNQCFLLSSSNNL
jgi:hypothetical protein